MEMNPQSSRSCRQRGYTMVELMVSITIALFLMAGLMTIVMHTRKTSASQSQMAQLQDGERVAMTILTDVIQQAGYFPDPTTNTISSFNALPSAISTLGGGPVNFKRGQVISGASGGAAGDSIAVRFMSPLAYATDSSNYLPTSIANCAGTSVKDTASHFYTNVFQVNNSTHYLQCLLYQDNVLVNTYNLVPGVNNMQIQYGVANNGTDNNVTYYVAAAGFSSNTDTLWQSVTSVRITLYFLLPQYGFTGGQTDSGATSSALQNLTMYVQRVIPIMSQSGG